MMKMPRPTTIDFETFAIEDRPDYPPVPTAVSIKVWGRKPKCYIWGHLTGNNCTWGEAREALERAYGNPEGVLFHHGKFDLAVAERYFDLQPPRWERTHDTLYLLFLDDPNQTELGLKQASERLLGLAPEERNAVCDWLVAHQPVPGIKISASTSHQAKSPFGAYIPFCPGEIVGAYANGDVERTEALFRKLWPSVHERGMGEAYDRERRLLQVLLDIEKQGMPVDLERLRKDVASYQEWFLKIDAWILKKLNITDPEFNLNSGQQVMEALVESGLIDESKVPRTPTGKLKSDEEAMSHVTDKALGAAFVYRSKLKTCLGTFMENWLHTAERSKGFIYTDWHQTRGSEGGGTRTGRLSSSPNFQNLSKEFPPIWRHEEKDPKKSRSLPVLPAALKGLPALPLIRCYVVPWAKDHILLDRDYSQQEPRILAHFEGGALMEQYQKDPWIDYHDNAKAHIERVLHRSFDRKHIKTINLGIIYGQGVGSLAERNGATVEETKEIRDAIYTLYPGLKQMYSETKKMAKLGEPITTWGGRKCLCEPPKIINGRIMEFSYKLINTLVQGSAGDCTKEAMIRYWERKPKDHYLYLSVHDELLVSVPKIDLHVGMALLRDCMESVEFDVLILSEGDIGENWADLKKYDKKGVRV